MATRKPRTNITLDDDVDLIFARLAKLRKMPKATLISEYVDAMKPHAQSMIEALELVEQNKNPSLVIGKMFADVHTQMGQNLNEIMSNLEVKND